MANGTTQENYTPAGGVPTDEDWTGEWVAIDQVDAVGFIAKLTGTDAPVAAWTADVTNYQKPDDDPSPTPITLTSDMSDQDPSGDAANINYLFQFDPCPRARWMRFNYAHTSAGSSSNLLTISMNKKARGY